MNKHENFAVVCLGVAVVAQGCAQVLGFEDENRPDFGIACTTPATCPGVDDACNTRICVSGTCGLEFAQKGALCQVSNFCDGTGHCLRANGVQCDQDAQAPQCFSGFCADGVCCDNACDGTCEACDLADSKGVCMLIPSNTDPKNECAKGECNGAGICIGDLGQSCSEGENCISSYCVDSTCCATADCPVGASCKTGTCQCPETNPYVCDGVCRDLAVDEENCGVCGTKCDVEKNFGCVDGECQDLTWALWPMHEVSDYDYTSIDGAVVDKVTKLMWQRDIAVNKYHWAAAKAYCKDLVLAGYDDWRVPTRIELVSIVNYFKQSPAIDEVAFPWTPPDYFWTSSPWAGSSTAARVVNFFDGFVEYGSKAVAHQVRCVR